MKKYFILIVLCCLYFTTFAQDTINFKRSTKNLTTDNQWAVIINGGG